MARLSIQAELRSERGKNAARRVRVTKQIPGILYGAGADAVAVKLDPKQIFAVLRSHSGHNTILDVQLKGGETSAAMIVDTQFEPIKSTILHVDLKRIAMDQKLRVSVPVHTTGEPKGVKQQGGIFEVVLREVEIECLPADIPDEITISAAELALGESLRIADLQAVLGATVQLVGDPHAVVCHVVTPRAEALPTAEAAEATAEPEVIKKGKAEEGEAAAEGDKAKKK